MCSVCGCGTSVIAKHASSEQRAGTHGGSAHDHDHPHTHHDHHHHHADGLINFGTGRAGMHVPRLSQERTISIERDILSKNDAFAATNRTRLQNAGVFALNLVSSPGSGKTSLLVRTITDLKGSWPIAVIEGDQQTSRDADRIRADRRTGRADQHRQRLSPRCSHGRPRARSSFTCIGWSAFRRKCGKSGLPGSI